MKRITLAMSMLVAAVTTVVAQDPTPPARPARPTEPTPAPAPAPRAVRPVRPMRIDIDPMPPMSIDIDMHDFDLMRDNARDLARAQADLAREASRIDVEQLREQAREASRLALEDMRFNIDIHEATRLGLDIAHAFTPLAAMAPMAPLAPMEPISTPMPASAPFGGIHIGRDFTDRLAPAPWAQGDPADSVYRAARNALNNGEYGRAAKLFADISKNYPKSAYQNDARYYEAVARYKVGTTEELKAAAKLLEPMASKGS